MAILLVPAVLKIATWVGAALTAKSVYKTIDNFITADDIVTAARNAYESATKNFNNSLKKYEQTKLNLINFRQRVLEDLNGIDRNWRISAENTLVNETANREVMNLLNEMDLSQEQKKEIIDMVYCLETGSLGAVATSLTPKVVQYSLEKIAILIGKSSTGKAISTLTGAVQKNAIYAWLGGGAKSAGGLGVQGGKSLASGLSTSCAFGIATAVLELISTNTLNNAKEEANQLAKKTQDFEIKAKILYKESELKEKIYFHFHNYFSEANRIRYSQTIRAKIIMIVLSFCLEKFALQDLVLVLGPDAEEKIKSITDRLIKLAY